MRNIIDFFSLRDNTNNFIARPYIIAEAGVNHEGKMDIAKRLIDEAKEGGADAIKFQTYKAETIASKNSPSYWDTSLEPTTSQFNLFKKYDKFWKKEFEELKNYCNKAQIEFMSTPFDIESSNFLNDLMPVYKISSSDITNFPFIEHICSFKKPIIISTGASELSEISNFISITDKFEVPTAILHCILNYPTDNKNANLGMIKDLQNKFPEHIIGYSDHTLPGDMENLKLATSLGALILEKHFTHDKSLKGNDHYHAMNKNDLIKLNDDLDRMFSLVGSLKKESIKSESVSRRNARRSLVASRSIKPGQVITSDDITWKRPALGICPSQIKSLIGKTAKFDIKEDDLLKWEMFS